MRVYPSSRGLDPARLAPGQDLVLKVDEAHGSELAWGVGALDYLDLDERERVDATAHQALSQWRDRYDGALTVEGVRWPFIWEWALFAEVFIPTIGAALATQRAIGVHDPESITWHGERDQLGGAVEVAAGHSGIPFTRAPRPLPGEETARTRKPPAARRVRQALFAAVIRFGLPSALRRDSVLLVSYWPMMPLLDHMLDRPDVRPAIVAQARPSGLKRTGRASMQGGWIGRPGPRALQRARIRFAEALETAGQLPTELEVGGMPLGRCLTDASLALAAERGAIDLATAVVWRRALRTRPRAAIVPFDSDPQARLLVCLAQETDILTVVFQHGAYVIPTELHDMKVPDLAAVWCVRTATPGHWHRPPCVVGYPLQHDTPPTRTWSGGRPPRVIVLAQSWEQGSMLLDPRDVMRHYVAAVQAVRDRLPGASIVLRPHPADPLAPVEALRRRFGELAVDVQTGLVELLSQVDLCIGASTTGTLQAALTGTPAVLLNVSGREWRWPLGGETMVPIARSSEELAAWLTRWKAGEVLPGREDLLAGLGAGGEPAHDALLFALNGHVDAPTSPEPVPSAAA